MKKEAYGKSFRQLLTNQSNIDSKCDKNKLSEYRKHVHF